MKKHFWRLLQISWLVLAVVTIYNSIWTLEVDASYCSGMYCETQNDCGLPCVCNGADNTCYSVL
jgi:hypothetical protein